MPSSKAKKPKKSKVESLLDKVRKNPSPTCMDSKQLDLVQHVINKERLRAFARLDEAISEALDDDKVEA